MTDDTEPREYRYGRRLIGHRVLATEPIYIDCDGSCDLDSGVCDCAERHQPDYD